MRAIERISQLHILTDVRMVVYEKRKTTNVERKKQTNKDRQCGVGHTYGWQHYVWVRERSRLNKAKKDK